MPMNAVARSWLGRSAAFRCKPVPTLPKSSYTTAVRNDRPFRMAVVGSGPAGFYTAYRVMSKIDKVKVDMYEALPVPFGLVRFGVAPDHPEVKVSRGDSQLTHPPQKPMRMYI